jgi:hypothetical protein
MSNLKLKISTSILNAVEGLPRFTKGLISGLQDIREQQQKWASSAYEASKAPENACVQLKTMTLTLTFEHEDFKSILKGLKNYFPKNSRIQRFSDSLKKSADSLHASSWHNLGFIAKEKGYYLPDATIDRNLPHCVNSVSVYFHRILPSLACITFECHLNDSLSNDLSSIQSKIHLGPVIFKSFIPLKRIPNGYSMGSSYEVSQAQINQRKDRLREEILNWIRKGFKWKLDNKYNNSFIDIYEIEGVPTQRENRQNWLDENKSWLGNYGINVHKFNSLEGKDFFITMPDESSEKYTLSHILSRFDLESQSKDRDLFTFKIGAVAVSATILNIITKYADRIKKLRSLGFENLYKRTKLTKRTQKNIQEIKTTLVILSRFEQELNNSKHSISSSMSEIGQLSYMMEDRLVNFSTQNINKANSRLKNIKDAANTIDAGLTNYLSIQNIYVMYKLQKWMFVLTFVVTIATIIGVLSGWDNLVKLYANLISFVQAIINR